MGYDVRFVSCPLSGFSRKRKIICKNILSSLTIFVFPEDYVLSRHCRRMNMLFVQVAVRGAKKEKVRAYED